MLHKGMNSQKIKMLKHFYRKELAAIQIRFDEEPDVTVKQRWKRCMDTLMRTLGPNEWTREVMKMMGILPQRRLRPTRLPLTKPQPMMVRDRKQIPTFSRNNGRGQMFMNPLSKVRKATGSNEVLNNPLVKRNTRLQKNRQLLAKLAMLGAENNSLVKGAQGYKTNANIDARVQRSKAIEQDLRKLRDTASDSTNRMQDINKQIEQVIAHRTLMQALKYQESYLSRKAPPVVLAPPVANLPISADSYSNNLVTAVPDNKTPNNQILLTNNNKTVVPSPQKSAFRISVEMVWKAVWRRTHTGHQDKIRVEEIVHQAPHQSECCSEQQGSQK